MVSSVFPLLVEQLVAGTALLLLLILGIAAVLFRAAAGDVLQPSSETHVAEDEALGVIIDGEPGPLYQSGRHRVDPTTGEEPPGEIDDWETVRFSTGRTTFAWSHVDEQEQTDIEITLAVPDPEQVWEQADSYQQPLRDVLKQLLSDATTETPLPELTAAAINEAGAQAYGLTVETISVETHSLQNAEVDGLDKLA